MSRRFQGLSKYRNIVLTAAKREESFALPPGFVNTGGDASPIHASQTLVAFRSGSSGNSVGVLPLSNPSASRSSATVIHVGSGLVSDIQFCPWEGQTHDTLATAGDDGSVKLWSIEKTELKESPVTPVWAKTCHERRVEAFAFNPAADGVIATCGAGQVRIWDTAGGDECLHTLEAGDLVQGISWKGDGSLLASVSRDNIMRIFDPRRTLEPIISGAAHTGIKPTRVVWIGNSDLVLTTGFSQRRDREIAIWDSRQLKSSLVSVKIDTSPGIFTPLYDEDTRLLFLAGKGDTAIRWWEINPESVESPITPGAIPYSSSNVYSAATLVPKASLSIMRCEVARILTVASDGSSILPISVTVPRKSHIDFHADIFPDTKGTTPPLSSAEWRAGESKVPDVVSLDPSKNKSENANLSKAATPVTSLASTSTAETLPATKPLASSRAEPRSETESLRAADAPSTIISRPSTPKFLMPKQSSYRFMTGKCQSKYEDIKNLSTTAGGEGNALQAHHSLLAFPLAGPGGRVAIWPVKNEVSDDGKVSVWEIPSEGLNEDITQPSSSFTAHTNRVAFVQFHPSISNVVLTGSPEQGTPTAALWDLTNQKEIAKFLHPDMILGCAFNSQGTLLATTCRDKQIRVFDLKSGRELQKGPSNEGVKGCRVLWLGESGKLLTVGFGRASQREIRVYDGQDLSKPLHNVAIDTSPSLLLPTYDEDTHLLYLTGRGESYTLIFEITDDEPKQVARFDSPGLQQGIAFLPKRTCDVRNIEVAKGFRLTQNCIESISLTVPRLKREYFQDDIFVPTRNTEKPGITLERWLQGENPDFETIDLRPSDMKLLSEAPVEIKVDKRAQVLEREQTMAEKQAASIDAMMERALLDAEDAKLPQDQLDGVADDEWDD
ncbi:hypothetical protein DFS34DRAFT_648832 [Phlyctochytrium arcticum]|nr:hypothetical protein DFS34DRAFT_648832 [Phlyctochytrium arcticum]